MSDYLMSVRCAAPALVETVSHYQMAVVTLISMTQYVDTVNNKKHFYIFCLPLDRKHADL